MAVWVPRLVSYSPTCPLRIAGRRLLLQVEAVAGLYHYSDACTSTFDLVQRQVVHMLTAGGGLRPGPLPFPQFHVSS